MSIMGKASKVAIVMSLAASVLVGGGQATEAANNIPSDDYIMINKQTHKLAYYQDKKLIATYPVATGKDNKSNKTPEGKLKIVKKVKNRPYYKGNIPGGDPRNPLGARWLELSVPGGAYAIHGTNNPNSIGKNASGGCIRMENKNVIALYNKVLLNTPVYIYNSSKSFSTVANELGYIKSNNKAKSPAANTKVYRATAKFGGFTKGDTFKAGGKTYKTSNAWYKKNLKIGTKYTYYYNTKNGQNLITQINK